MLTVLGIDPGLRRTGFGIISIKCSVVKYEGSGTIKTESKMSDAWRLKEIFNSLHSIISDYSPTNAVVEKVFANSNPKSTLALGQARGAAMTALASKNIPVFEISSTEIKKTIVGNGHADKIQVQFMVRRLLNLKGSFETDSSDALACALAFERINKK